jgi:hypothetical protein
MLQIGKMQMQGTGMALLHVFNHAFSTPSSADKWSLGCPQQSTLSSAASLRGWTLR